MPESTTKSRVSRHAAAAALLAALLCAPAPAGAQDAAAVLAKGSGLYFEASLAFQRALGRPVQVYDLAAGAPSLPRSLKAAAAFGSKAAALKYPAGAKLIILLAPGYTPPAGSRATVVSAFPEPAQALAAYKSLQPGLARLAVFYRGAPATAYLAELARAAARLGLEIIPVPLDTPENFPDALRALAGADAYWLLPEPALINKTSLKVLSEFSCAHKLPFYAPSAGLTELGAAASFAPGADEAAAAAADALTRALAGEALPATLYAPRSALTVNGDFSRRCGLPLKLPAPAGGAR
ncbi:MAG: hypothetical protein CVU79_11605 [Elusimicrobia bacterium HGW-Elusimicrobia-3]|nr:MAG: hypothetical protein CVU79_11605 [Elusimicrobia bacterium HGW-Elusimicrobia-3]